MERYGISNPRSHPQQGHEAAVATGSEGVSTSECFFEKSLRLLAGKGGGHRFSPLAPPRGRFGLTILVRPGSSNFKPQTIHPAPFTLDPEPQNPNSNPLTPRKRQVRIARTNCDSVRTEQRHAAVIITPTPDCVSTECRTSPSRAVSSTIFGVRGRGCMFWKKSWECRGTSLIRNTPPP